MAEIVYDQEWMDIFECIGNLPRIKTVSLSFRVPVALPIQAFTTFIQQAKSLETLYLSGLQLSIPKTTTASAAGDNNHHICRVDELIHAFRDAQLLKNLQLCRHRTIRGDATAKVNREMDPLLLAVASLPNLKWFHIDRTDIFSDQHTLELVCRAPIQTLKIGTCERTVKLEQCLPRMTPSLEENGELKELIVHHILRDDALVAMADLIQHNTSLDKIALRIESDDFGAKLSDALRANTTLQSLDLNLLSRDRAGFRKNMAVIADALARNKQSALTTLKLNGAKGIRSSGLILEPFLKMLQLHNYTLQSLEINRNAVTLSADINFYLKLNRIGRRHLLRATQDDGEHYDYSDGVHGKAHTFYHHHRETTLNSDNGSQGHCLSFRNEFANVLIQNKDDLRVLFYFISRNPLILPVS